MKKILSLVLLSTLFSCDTNESQVVEQQIPQPVEIHTLIPNVKFEQALVELGIDDIVDGKILNAKAEAITKLQVEHKEIEDVTGLSAFKNLTWLSLWDNKFTTIDVTKLTKLQLLGLSECPVSTIDLSKNTELVELNFQHAIGRVDDPTYPFGKTAGFTSLDFSKNLKLERVYVMMNRLSSIDVSMLPKLTDLWIGNTDMGKNDSNTIKSLDLRNNPRLQMAIFMNMPHLNYLNIKGSNPRRVMTIGCPNLNSIIVTSIQAANLGYASGLWEKDPACVIVE
jgi:Leucine-rich repeat (LRR) protein